MARSFRLREAPVEIAIGDRVVIDGDQGVNRRLFFAAIAGLWPWGRGKITMPPRDETLFIAQHGYMPAAPLREILSYPRAPQKFTEEEFLAAMEACGLGHIIPRMNDNIRWDQKFDSDEQACIRVANALLLKPRWLFIDDLLEGLEKHTIDRLVEVLSAMKDTAVVYIGRSDAVMQVLSPRVLHLELVTTAPAG